MNILLVSLDTTRADHLGCYGFGRGTSPHLDRFAAGGTIFTECFSTHIPTHPAHTAMMTGRDPFETGVIAQGGRVTPDESVKMLAQILQENGFFTAAADNLGRWFTRGFDVYEGYSWEMPAGGPWRKGEAVAPVACRVLDRCAAQPEPFFAFLHFWDAHTPYLPPAPFDRLFYAGCETDPRHSSMDPVWEFEPFAHYFAEWLPGVTDIEFPKAQYDASLAYMDSCLAHVFTRLGHLGLLDTTCVVITADHGEELDEHGCWFDHHGLYDTNLRVPLIVRLPGQQQGRQTPGFVRTLDITPTLLELAGVRDWPGRELLQGTSFVPLLQGSPTPSRGTCDELFLTECTWMRKRGFRSHRYKYIMALEPDFHGKPPEELYDLMEDPGETRNLAAELPAVAEDLRGRLLQWKEEREAQAGRGDPLEQQEISLRRIGDPAAPIPRRGP